MQVLGQLKWADLSPYYVLNSLVLCMQVLFGWMPGIVIHALFGAGYFCISINIFEFYSETQLTYLEIV